MRRQIRELIQDSLSEVALLMEQKFAQIGGVPEPGSDLDQAGLRDGVNIVRDFLANGEWGLALEHLCYMVEETSLPISPKAYASMMAAGQEMQVNVRTLRAIKPPAE